MDIPQQKIVKFVLKLNENDEYTKLTQSQQSRFEEQFQEMQTDQKQTWVEHSINEISCTLVEGHIHKAQTYFVFLITVINDHALEIAKFHYQIEDLLHRCFRDEKKVKRRQLLEFDEIFKSIGVGSAISDKKKPSSHKKSFFAKLCACLSWD